MLLPAQVEHMIEQMKNKSAPMHVRMNYLKQLEDMLSEVKKEVSKFCKENKVKERV